MIQNLEALIFTSLWADNASCVFLPRKFSLRINNILKQHIVVPSSEHKTQLETLPELGPSKGLLITWKMS